jgi:Xanthomonas XOO_2897-like deaminase
MPKVPNSKPADSPRCDPRLPDAALRYRMTANPQLTTRDALGAINVTAWLYRDRSGVEGIQVNPNVTIAELTRVFGPAPTPDAEVGFHSEGRAAEWFRVRPNLQVLQIFTERIPCRQMCAPMLKNYYPGVPWYYYYDASSWVGNRGELLKRAGDILKAAYGL